MKLDIMPPAPGKSICIVTTGCVECVMDANFLEHHFEERHKFNVFGKFHDADFIILLGCAFNDHSENYTRGVIDFLRANKRADAELLVMGCISKIRPELRTTQDQTSLSLTDIQDVLRHDVSTHSLVADSPTRRQDDSLHKLIDSKKENGFRQGSPLSRISPAIHKGCFKILNKYKSLVSLSALNADTTLLRVSMGCMGGCSFCSIRTARGKVISKPPELILAEFRRLVQQGRREIALVGTNIGDYGKERHSDLLHLLEPMVATPGDFRLRLRNLNPRWILANFHNFADLLASGKIIFVHAPLQSGNNRILQLMNRGYQADTFIDRMQTLASLYPSVVLKTDLMVGFPSETEAEFQDSLQVVRQKIFHHAVVMRYTDRPNTRAEALSPKVPEPEIMRRFRKLLLTEMFNQPLRRGRALYRLNYQNLWPKKPAFFPAISNVV